MGRRSVINPANVLRLVTVFDYNTLENIYDDYHVRGFQKNDTYQHIQRYTKTVVAATVNAQKYNPELTWMQRNPDPRIAQLSDKLRHIRQVVLSQLTLAPESDSFIRDEEGSGSGHPPVTQWVDDDGEPGDPNWLDEGSASGDDSIPPVMGGGEKPEIIQGSVPKVNRNNDQTAPQGPGSGAVKPIVDSCARLIVVVLLSRISLVLLNG